MRTGKQRGRGRRRHVWAGAWRRLTLLFGEARCRPDASWSSLHHGHYLLLTTSLTSGLLSTSLHFSVPSLQTATPPSPLHTTTTATAAPPQALVLIAQPESRVAPFRKRLDKFITEKHEEVRGGYIHNSFRSEGAEQGRGERASSAMRV